MQNFNIQMSEAELVEFIEKSFYKDGYFNENIGEFNVSIYTDDYDPFSSCDEVPTILSFSTRYSYGVKELESKEGETINIVDECEDLDKVESWLKRNDYIFKPFEKYEHGGIALHLLSTKDANLTCRFDSCIGGYLVMKKSDLRAFRGVKKLNKKLLEDEFEYWGNLLDSFNNYLNGYNLEIRIENPEKNFYEYFSFSDFEEAMEFALPILRGASEERAS